MKVVFTICKIIRTNHFFVRIVHTSNTIYMFDVKFNNSELQDQVSRFAVLKFPKLRKFPALFYIKVCSATILLRKEKKKDEVMQISFMFFNFQETDQLFVQ